MCLVFIAYNVHPDYRLVLASNRDEFYVRPTAAAAFWDDTPGVYGGRDLEQGGSWLAVTTQGRLATVTNYRDPAEFERRGRSRGQLLNQVLQANEPIAQVVARFNTAEANEYNGFNLIAGDLSTHDELYWISNKSTAAFPTRLVPGIYGLSNHLLDTPWPKVASGRTAFAQLVQNASSRAWHDDADPLFELLASEERAPLAALPDTGIGQDKELFLSSRFIRSEVYGTRASSVVLVPHNTNNEIIFYERRFDVNGQVLGESRATIRMQTNTGGESHNQ